MKKNGILLFAAAILMAIINASCSKDNNTPGIYGIKFLEQYNDNEIPADTMYVASDLSYHCRALISPAGNIASARYSVYFDAFEALHYDYTVDANNDQGFLLDSLSYEFIYNNLAGVVNVVTLMVKATDKDGNSKETHLSFRIQPVNYPFQFRFYDFNTSDTLVAGTQVTIMPFFSPLIVSQQIETMNVYLKAGFSAEQLVDTFSTGDFYYYQTGYLREYNYTVPADAISGSGIVHRFELKATDGSRHVIQHTILVQ